MQIDRLINDASWLINLKDRLINEAMWIINLEGQLLIADPVNILNIFSLRRWLVLFKMVTRKGWILQSHHCFDKISLVLLK